METLKIALLAPEFLPNWGGVGTYCIELAKQLCEKAELHVITTKRKIEGSDISYSEEDISDYFGGKIHVHIISEAKETFLYNASFQYSLLRFLPKMTKEFGIDIIHGQHAHMSDILYKLKRKRVNCLTTLHTTINGQREAIKLSDMRFPEMEPSEKWQIGLYPALLLAEHYSLRKCQNYITVSNWMKGLVSEQFPLIKNVSVIYNGTDPVAFSPGKNENRIFGDMDKPIVLFSSRMTVVKGAHYLINAIPEVLSETQDVHFAFVGAGDNSPWINMLDKHGINKKHYSFHGYLDYSLLPSMYSEAYCYMLPTLYENFPIRMLEAMSSGVPVIASNICGIPEAIDDGTNGLLLPPKNSSSIAEATINLLNDEKLANDMGNNARQTVIDRFTWDICGDQTLEKYKQCLEGI